MNQSLDIYLQRFGLNHCKTNPFYFIHQLSKKVKNRYQSHQLFTEIENDQNICWDGFLLVYCLTKFSSRHIVKDVVANLVKW